jgi:hypothetical protein
LWTRVPNNTITKGRIALDPRLVIRQQSRHWHRWSVIIELSAACGPKQSLTEPIVRYALEPAFERLSPDATAEHIVPAASWMAGRRATKGRCVGQEFPLDLP